MIWLTAFIRHLPADKARIAALGNNGRSGFSCQFENCRNFFNLRTDADTSRCLATEFLAWLDR